MVVRIALFEWAVVLRRSRPHETTKVNAAQSAAKMFLNLSAIRGSTECFKAVLSTQDTYTEVKQSAAQNLDESIEEADSGTK